tara:strand:- start:1966 stop:2964 length:999 start_codon:yes stop_codon:yes gene_type:complete
MNVEEIKSKILNSENISVKETIFIFDLIMTGKLNDIEIAGILIALKSKIESKNEILGATISMREKSLKISSPDNAVDTCGTGGDMSGTLNISTSAAIVAASAGATIAKHGNRSISSKSGSADMLEKLGYKITNDLKLLESELKNNNFCFLFAQYHHSAMKHVINVRKTLGTRTIFNLLGPLTNPANTKKQVLGVFEKRWTRLHCEVLKDLESKHCMIVHGDDGLDEISLSGITHVAELKDSKIIEYKIDPRDYGYKYINNNDIKGGDPEYNAKKFIEMLDGENRNFQNIVELNAGAVLYISGKSKNLKEGFELARNVIEKKISKNFLEKIVS